MNVRIGKAAEAELALIAQLAGVIWRSYYPAIISNEQIEYMLERMFGLEEMKRQIAEGTVYYQLICDDDLIGFASLAPTSDLHQFKLDKLYVHERFRGRGFGKLLLNHVVEKVRDAGASCLILAVNKQNTDAITMYQRNGFQIRESLVNDIGGGFVMDDHVMERRL